MATRPDCAMETLPCGCRMGTMIADGVNTFVFEPCSTSCPNYAYAVAESKARGNTIELRSVD